MSDQATATWRDSLPAELQSNPTLSTIPDVATLAKNHVNLQGILGSKRTELPNDKWTDEQRGQFWNQLGRPEAPDKYTQFKVELPGVEFPKEEMDKTYAEFHKIGLTDKQAQAVLGLHFGNMKTGLELSAKQKEQEKAMTEEALKKEFGSNYEGKMAMLNATLARFGSQELVEWAEKSGAGNNAAFVKALVKIGESLMEDTSTTPKGTAVNNDPRANAQNEIGRLKSDQNFLKALMNKFDPGHEAATQQWTMLHRIAAGGQK